MKGQGIGCWGVGAAIFGDFQAFPWLEIAFAPEPIFHGGLEPVEGDAVAGFEKAIGDGEGVVEDGVVGEVAHGEVVDLADGAGVALAGGVDAVDGEAAGEHGSTVKDGDGGVRGLIWWCGACRKW